MRNEFLLIAAPGFQRKSLKKMAERDMQENLGDRNIANVWFFFPEYEANSYEETWSSYVKDRL